MSQIGWIKCLKAFAIRKDKTDLQHCPSKMSSTHQTKNFKPHTSTYNATLFLWGRRKCIFTK